MTQPQILSCLVLAGTMALFVWGRLRYDLVALIALLAGLVAGIVPFNTAFSGFSDDIVIIVASALLVSAAVEKSGIIAQLIRPISPYLSTTTAQVVALTATVMVLSAFVKNIGALAMLMPVAFQLARKNGTSPAHLLMPMSFGALLGGIVTLVGTSPNIIVARVRSEISGEPFQMFDFAPVGIGLAIGGLAFLAIGWRLIPTDRKGAATMDAAFNIEAYTTEVVVPEGSPFVGKTVGELEKLGDGDVDVVTLIQARGQSYRPPNTATLTAGVTIILQGEPDALERIISDAELKLAHDGDAEHVDTPDDDIGVMEAVVTSGSPLVDKSAVQVRMLENHRVTLLAVSRSGRRILQRLGSVRLKAGDVIVLKGDLKVMPESLGELGVLPLAERQLSLGRGRRRYIPGLVLIAAMTLVAFNLVPVAVAFFGAAVTMLILKSLSLREAYDSVDMPILVMLAALIPVSDTLRSTGTTDLLAGWLSQAGSVLPPTGMLALIMVAAMAVTPFLNNAATVLVMAPIAASFAKALGLNPDPFLMAVAIGAACDFLTPIGHQCNTLVMGAGGYRFTDYPRLGLPLSVMVVVVGTPLIAMVWSF